MPRRRRTRRADRNASAGKAVDPSALVEATSAMRADYHEASFAAAYSRFNEVGDKYKVRAVLEALQGAKLISEDVRKKIVTEFGEELGEEHLQRLSEAIESAKKDMEEDGLQELHTDRTAVIRGLRALYAPYILDKGNHVELSGALDAQFAQIVERFGLDVNLDELEKQPLLMAALWELRSIEIGNQQAESERQKKIRGREVTKEHLRSLEHRMQELAESSILKSLGGAEFGLEKLEEHKDGVNTAKNDLNDALEAEKKRREEMVTAKRAVKQQRARIEDWAKKEADALLESAPIREAKELVGKKQALLDLVSAEFDARKILDSRRDALAAAEEALDTLNADAEVLEQDYEELEKEMAVYKSMDDLLSLKKDLRVGRKEAKRLEKEIAKKRKELAASRRSFGLKNADVQQYANALDPVRKAFEKYQEVLVDCDLRRDLLDACRTLDGIGHVRDEGGFRKVAGFTKLQIEFLETKLEPLLNRLIDEIKKHNKGRSKKAPVFSYDAGKESGMTANLAALEDVLAQWKEANAEDLKGAVNPKAKRFGAMIREMEELEARDDLSDKEQARHAELSSEFQVSVDLANRAAALMKECVKVMHDSELRNELVQALGHLSGESDPEQFALFVSFSLSPLLKRLIKELKEYEASGAKGSKLFKHFEPGPDAPPSAARIEGLLSDWRKLNNSFLKEYGVWDKIPHDGLRKLGEKLPEATARKLKLTGFATATDLERDREAADEQVKKLETEIASLEEKLTALLGGDGGEPGLNARAVSIAEREKAVFEGRARLVEKKAQFAHTRLLVDAGLRMDGMSKVQVAHKLGELENVRNAMLRKLKELPDRHAEGLRLIRERRESLAEYAGGVGADGPFEGKYLEAVKAREEAMEAVKSKDPKFVANLSRTATFGNSGPLSKGLAWSGGKLAASKFAPAAMAQFLLEKSATVDDADAVTALANMDKRLTNELKSLNSKLKPIDEKLAAIRAEKEIAEQDMPGLLKERARTVTMHGLFKEAALRARGKSDSLEQTYRTVLSNFYEMLNSALGSYDFVHAKKMLKRFDYDNEEVLGKMQLREEKYREVLGGMSGAELTSMKLIQCRGLLMSYVEALQEALQEIADLKTAEIPEIEESPEYFDVRRALADVAAEYEVMEALPRQDSLSMVASVGENLDFEGLSTEKIIKICKEIDFDKLSQSVESPVLRGMIYDFFEFVKPVIASYEYGLDVDSNEVSELKNQAIRLKGRILTYVRSGVVRGLNAHDLPIDLLDRVFAAKAEFDNDDEMRDETRRSREVRHRLLQARDLYDMPANVAVSVGRAAKRSLREDRVNVDKLIRRFPPFEGMNLQANDFTSKSRIDARFEAIDRLASRGPKHKKAVMKSLKREFLMLAWMIETEGEGQSFVQIDYLSDMLRDSYADVLGIGRENILKEDNWNFMSDKMKDQVEVMRGVVRGYDVNYEGQMDEIEEYKSTKELLRQERLDAAYREANGEEVEDDSMNPVLNVGLGAAEVVSKALLGAGVERGGQLGGWGLRKVKNGLLRSMYGVGWVGKGFLMLFGADKPKSVQDRMAKLHEADKAAAAKAAEKRKGVFGHGAAARTIRKERVESVQKAAAAERTARIDAAKKRGKVDKERADAAIAALGEEKTFQAISVDTSDFDEIFELAEIEACNAGLMTPGAKIAYEARIAAEKALKERKETGANKKKNKGNGEGRTGEDQE